MLFFTYWFVIFAGVALPLYWFIPHPCIRRALLLASCAIFHYHFAGPAGVAPIIVLGVAAYFAGLSGSRRACSLAMVLCVAALIFYKYTLFLCHDVLGLGWPAFSPLVSDVAMTILPAAPPLGISFFVFEFIHYLYDVRKGTPPIRNPADFCSFAIFWPSIVAGPIKRYEQFVPSLHAGIRNVGQYDVALGIIRLAGGVLKKIIADNLTAYTAFWVSRFAGLDLASRWWILTTIGLRILLDFSGYSDMAIGFARMMGITLPENFNWPYTARSINDFWRRWHISLSTWIRDYIYIPLGGSRHGPARRIANGVVAFALCGLWHGAAWNFLVWGLYHGVGLAVNIYYRRFTGRAGRLLSVWLGRNRLVQWAVTLLFVQIGWLFFFYPLPQACKMLKLLFGISH